MSKQNKYYHTNVNIIEYPFNDIDISNYDLKYIRDLYKSFNKSTDVIEKHNIAKQLPSGIFPICRFCGDIIINANFKLALNGNYIHLYTPSVYCREINGKKYFLSCCEKCLLSHFQNDLPSSTKYYFMKANKYGQYSYGYSDDEYKRICSMTTGVTLKSMINKWGNELGKQKWDEYCNKQAVTNTFEYKAQTYNWDINQFNEFNKSRGVTLENLIKKYGESLGKQKWETYLSKQHITKSSEYMIKKYGEQRAKEINQSKALTLTNFIKKYGEDVGNEKYNSIINKLPKYYSNISQKCFNEIDSIIDNKYTTYYATKNTEYGVKLNNNKYVCLDYFIKELNICIEFNGTHFHADKRFYDEKSHPNPFIKTLTAKEIWDNDNDRYNMLLDQGITTYIIWEYDYINKLINIENFINEILNKK